MTENIVKNFNQSNNGSHISDDGHIVNYSSNQTALYILEMTGQMDFSI